MTYMTVLYRVRSVNTPRLRLTYYNARRVPIVSNVPVWVDIILMQDRLRIAAKWDGGGGVRTKEPWSFTGGLTVLSFNNYISLSFSY